MDTVYTTSQLVLEVRDQLNEYNIDSITDEAILRVLSRAKDSATTILAKTYPDQIVEVMDPITASNIVLPEGLHEERINKVEYLYSSNYLHDVERISYRDRTKYTTTHKGIPRYYYIVKNKLFLLPEPQGGELVLWYIPEPEPFIEEEGRILQINAASKYIVLDSIGDNISAEEDELKNYWQK